MSMPVFAAVDPDLTLDAAVSQVISSIAYEELSLSHILNAEGEKIQYALGLLTGQTPGENSISDVLAVNASVVDMLTAVRQTQASLLQKMQAALAAVDAAALTDVSTNA